MRLSVIVAACAALLGSFVSPETSYASGGFCSAEFEPVCGTNGVRYSNGCSAKDARTRVRTGGALVELFIVDQSFWVWSTNDAFIDEAIEAALGNVPSRVPSFALRRRPLCSGPQSFHVDPQDMAWADFTIEVCDGRVSDIEGDLNYWINNVKRYCPWSAEVVSVYDYR